MNKPQRVTITRLVTGYCLLLLVLRYLEFVTPSRMQGPPLFNLHLDVTYWLYKLMNIPSLIVHSRTGAILFDIILFLSGFLVVFYPLRKIWIITFSIFAGLYVITFNSFVMHHGAPMNGLFIVFLPFWVTDHAKAGMLWNGVRYYTCFVYFVSFLWKTWWGDAFFYWNNGIYSFKYNMYEYIYHNPDTILCAFYRWTIRHDWFLNAGNRMIFLLEGLMVIGFFTKKYDRILIWIPIIIHVATYFFAEVFFMEMLVLDFSFLSLRQLTTIGRKFPILIYPYRHVKENYTEDLSFAK
jgi:hypothetical protein